MNHRRGLFLSSWQTLCRKQKTTAIRHRMKGRSTEAFSLHTFLVRLLVQKCEEYARASRTLGRASREADVLQTEIRIIKEEIYQLKG